MLIGEKLIWSILFIIFFLLENCTVSALVGLLGRARLPARKIGRLNGVEYVFAVVHSNERILDYTLNSLGKSWSLAASRECFCCFYFLGSHLFLNSLTSNDGSPIMRLFDMG